MKTKTPETKSLKPLILSTASLEEAIGFFLQGSYDSVSVQDESGNHLGFITPRFILQVYQKKIPNSVSLAEVFQVIPPAIRVENFPAGNHAEELRDIIQNSSDSIYVTDGEGVTLMVNRAFEEMSGITRDEVLGKCVHALEDRRMFTPSVTSLVLKEKRQITIIQELKNGKKVIATGVPILNAAGQVYRVVCNSKDFEELQVLQAYLAKREEDEIRGVETSLDIREKGFVFESPKMRQIIELVKRIASVDTTILLTGESGVGKSVLARYIHLMSPRTEGRFVEVNCGAIPEGLLESELFGYEGGAFTDARKSGKPGIFEAAHGGTLFLDEISELSPTLQVKLLNAIQTRQIVRVGGVDPVSVDVRIISATNKNLEERVRQGAFRLDLYYRLNVVPVILPPLRERREDIIPLTQFFLKKHGDRYGRNITLRSDALDLLVCFEWPGNIRELENVIERAVVTLNTDDIDAEALRHFLCCAGRGLGNGAVTVNRVVSLKSAREELERQLISAAFTEYRNSYRVAEILGISQSTAHRKIHRYCNNSETG